MWQYASGDVYAVLSKITEGAYRLLLSGSAVVASKLLEMAYTGFSNLNNPLHHKAALCVCMLHQRHLAGALQIKGIWQEHSTLNAFGRSTIHQRHLAKANRSLAISSNHHV